MEKSPYSQPSFEEPYDPLKLLWGDDQEESIYARLPTNVRLSGSPWNDAPPPPLPLDDCVSPPEQKSPLKEFVHSQLNGNPSAELECKPLTVQTFGSLLNAAEAEPPQTIVEKFLRLGDVSMIGAKAKEKKSFFVLQLAMSIASGRTFLSLQTTKTKVLYVDGEFSPHDLGTRLKRMCGEESPDYSQNLLFHTSRAHPEEKSYFPYILKNIEAQPELDNVGLFIFDPFYRYVVAGTEIDCAVMARNFEELQSFAFQRNAAVLLVHHFPKGSRSSNSHIEQIAGSSTISRSLDSLITLTRNNTPDCTNVEFTTRHFREPKKMVIRWLFNRFMVDPSVSPDSGQINAQSEKKRERKAALLERIPPEGIDKSELQSNCETIEIKRSTFYAYLKELENVGQIKIEEEKVFKTLPEAI